MLTWFRDNAKIFLIAVVVIFVGMIFIEWGRGGIDSPGSSRLAMGTVNGEELEPAMYDAARQEVYASMENQMLNMGYPNSESQLALAMWLQQHPKVEHVNYPGLVDSPHYNNSPARPTDPCSEPLCQWRT